MSRHVDPQADPWDLRSCIYEGFIDAELCDFSSFAGLARLPVSRV